MWMDIMVPIDRPGFLPGFQAVSPEPYMFDRQDRFTSYRHEDLPYTLMKDDHHQWYLAVRWECESLTEVKYARQVHRPSYVDKQTTLKLVDYMNETGFSARMADFDKAFVHTTVFADRLEKVPADRQLRIANADGEDDPAVIRNLHFIDNLYKSRRTRFLSGFETYSIATITENRFYLEQVHLPASASLYLQYFVYYHQYGHVPSKQMMAKMLENLWASTQAMNTGWNPALFTAETIPEN
ncbi:hypothetical protein M3221_05340 [Domibacillus indicus]|uniref:hypothetical protein n=1 Tax=Domibacillus indicus TaxID=1437523 RepID=UPI00203EE834|nr:hypothetical protein [Domibacillus indicus]MCM3787843.1 hypothetical protein [Domibacillus indicus]